MRYLAYRQAGRVTLPSEVYTHIRVFIYINIIDTFLPLYAHKRRPPALAISSILLVFRAPQRLQVEDSRWASLLTGQD